MRDPERVRQAPRAQHGLGRAAAPLAVGRLVRPELQRDGDHLGPALALEQRGDRGVHPAAEGDQDPLAGRGARRAAAPSRAGRRARGAARRRRGPPSGGGSVASPPSSASISSGPIAAASSTRRALGQLGARPPRPRLGAQPSASKVDPRRSRPSRTSSEMRIRSPQGAPPAEPVKRAVGRGPAPRAVPEVVLDRLEQVSSNRKM